MGAGTQQLAEHDWRLGQRGGAENIGIADGAGEIGRGDDIGRDGAQLGGQRLRLVERTAAQGQLVDGEDGAIGLRQIFGYASCAQDHQIARVGARQKCCGQHGGGGGATGGEFAAIDLADNGAVLAIEQRVDAGYGGEAGGVVFRKDRHQFDADMLACLPGGHQQQIAIDGIAADMQMLAQWRFHPLGKSGLERGNQVRPIKALANVLCGIGFHLPTIGEAHCFVTRGLPWGGEMS